MTYKQKGAEVNIVICSGGMDSVTLAHWLTQRKADISLMAFNYGQRHFKELEFAYQCAEDLDVKIEVINLTQLGKLLAASHSALVDTEAAVPEGHYAAESMKATVVPNRNAIMLNIAAGIAIARNASFVATGVHAGDHAIYPDCRPWFIDSQVKTLRIANEGFCKQHFNIYAPFLLKSKNDIAQIGQECRVDYTKTWSCYKGGEIHCGVCGTCVERKEALATIGDPTKYAS